MPDRLRLFVCRQCRTVEVVPWCGENLNCKHPECEDALESCAARHRIPSDPSRFHSQVSQVDMDKSIWDAHQDIVVERLLSDPGDTGAEA